ncbi:hypothetical protein G9G39_06830 [Cronobacter sp. EKM101R]|uniref:hypothetical protein n=1 Tax=Cronobacter TaxID=413496 RepID=UPI0013EAE139|nr:MULTISPECIES: hypothetical protein [Cronobacter]KAF6596773.1 hypothetical protein G9G39_06830 [Cronobacter sp. EKM101R]KAF6599599.1 hypothetical protein G9G38_06465 [Cronobacter sp. EKM102R]MDK1185167.1 hypothetical protein [Cronobacter turicensis]MDK1195298.1 hypothetical protein [Cronobacter dublinensis]MDK1200441.1 hypothetical protein [Cronobacter dublinensis]
MEGETLPAKLVSPVNIPPAINAIICSGKASYSELQNSLSVRDMYNLLEIISVEAFNRRVWQKHQE